MALTFKSPTEFANEYLTHLKSLRPEVNRDQTDSDWFVRSRVLGGLLSGVTSDLVAMWKDIFPQSSRREGLEKHLQTWFDSGFIPAQQSQGYVRVTGATGSVAAIGLEFLHQSTGNTYILTENSVLAATSERFPVQSVNTGQDQNLLEDTELSLPSPPAGFDPSAFVDGGPLSDGRDDESLEEAAARVLDRIRTPLAGGKESDYKQFARDADPAVVSANVIRHPYGLGTVAVIITAGTTDIDGALDAGLPVIVTPSPQLVDTVQEYIDIEKPITDCAFVQGPIEKAIAVSVRVRYATGNGSTILASQTLTQEQLVEREVKRAIYKTPAGGRQFGASGFVLASDIEEMIDSRLSAQETIEGSTVQILLDREVDDLSATGPNQMILGIEVPVPGTITILEF